MSAAPIQDTDIQPRAEEILGKVAAELLAGSRVITAFEGTSEGMNGEIQLARFAEVLIEWLNVEFRGHTIESSSSKWICGNKRGASWTVTVSAPTAMTPDPDDKYIESNLRDLELPASNFPGGQRPDELF